MRSSGLLNFMVPLSPNMGFMNDAGMMDAFKSLMN
jgi:hypothetical protein